MLLSTPLRRLAGLLALLSLLLAARFASAQVQPGNALAFDGTDDYVALPNTTPVPTGNGTYTLEAWIKPNAMGIYGIIGWGNWGTTNQVNALRLSPTGIINYWWGPDLVVTTPDLSGHWHYVVATFDGTTRTIYLDGVAVGSDTPGSHTVPSPSNLRIGCTNGPSPGGGYEYFNGSIDEVRIWSVARSAAQVKAAYTSWPAAPQTGLVASYGCNQGTAGGSNASITNLTDQSGNASTGALTNFALSGSTSNWVESYALVVPTLTATTAVTTTGFTANWAAPASGTVSGYVLDYATSPTFAPVAGSFSPASGATSQAVSGLQANRNYYYRLRADKTSGTVAGQGAYASGTVRTPSGQTPPGNALAFDGANDYVAVSTLPAANNLAPAGGFTLETWVYVTATTIHSLIRKDGDYNLYLNPGGLLSCDVWPGGLGTAPLTTTTTATALAANHWYHVAATWNGTATKLYLNGVDVTGTATARTGAASSPLQLGSSGTYGQYLTGRLDETRLYNAALTPAQVQADMTSTSAAVPGSLLLYYNFDQGTAGGANAAVTTLTDQSSSLADGTLTNFDLSSGNTTSNWVESYALVVPTLAAATANAATSFTANWTAPALGTVDNGYRLDVATSRDFTAASLVAGSPLTVAGTSQAVTGLSASQTYYYRVRADKTSVTGQGAYTATGVRAPFTPMMPPGNALAFDGTDDYVSGNNNQLPQGNAARTLEAWVLTTASGNNVVVNYGTATSNLRSGLLVVNGKAYYVGEGNDLQGTKVVNDGHWHHMAATYDGTTLKLYVDGVLDVSSTPTVFNTTGFDWNIGKRIPPLTSTEQFNGRLDEVRIYSAALTQAQVQADMTSTSPAVAGSLVAYYNFDQGTAGAANAGYTTLTDQSGSGNFGTLNNFNLGSGNTTSNWVESYALLQPTNLVASATTSTGFTASWTAPLLNGAAPASGEVEGYVLDVSTSSTFASGVTSFATTGYGTTSVAATGLANGTNYYLRVRAEKASVTGQGDYSATATTHTIGTDAFLTSLTANAGTLSPAFASGTLAYTLPVVAGQGTFTLTPTASNSYTSITANGAAVTSGTATTSYPAGTLVTLVLTSEDGQATRTYTVQSVNTPDYYRSVASGNWGDASTWEGSDDNATWSPVPYPPSASLQPTVSVRSGHVVTVAAYVQANRTTVLSGGTLTVAPGTSLELLNGSASSSSNADLTVQSGGTLTVPATAVLLVGRLSGTNGYTGSSATLGFLTVQSGGTFTAGGLVLLNSGSTATSLAAGTSTFSAGSRAILFATTAAPIIPVATWDPAATLELGGAVANTSVATSLNGKTLGSLDVNLTGSGLHVLLSGTGTATLTGNLTVTSTGTGTLRLLVLATTTGGALTVNGSYVQNGGLVNGCAAAGVALTSAITVAVSVAGSFTVNGGSFTANQGYTTTATTIRPNPLTIGGDLTVGTGATFSLVSALGSVNNVLSVAAVNYITSRVNLLGNFTNNGTFTTGNTVATNTGQQLYFAKSGGQTFASAGTISGRVNVTVNAGSTLDLGTSAFTGTGTFTTVAGSTLRLGSPAGISASGTATGNVQNTGTRAYNGSFELNGTAAQNTGTGFPATVGTMLTFNNPAGVTLSQALAVTGTLSLTQGVVTTAATNLLTLGSSGTVLGTLDATATNTGYVQGPFKRWISAAATSTTAFPVGTATVARPASISFTTAPTAAGTLTAEFVPTDSGSNGLPLTEGSLTINKAAEPGFWRVSATDGLAGGTYSPSFTYTSLTGTITRSYTNLVLLKRVDSSSPWTLQGTHVTTTGTQAAPVLSRTGLSGFSEFTAGGDGAGPLPVQLVAFTATANGPATVALAWTTASELNSARFEVERSIDGVRFTQLGAVTAAGSSASVRLYGYLDAAAPAGLSYYRLRLVDQDGTASYSPVRVVMLSGTGGLALYPNPAPQGAAILTGVASGAVVRVLDTLGRVVATATADAAGTVALGGLAPGLYVVQAGSSSARLAVE